MRSTIRDVSRMAGVSVGTVSHALNSPQLLQPATLERVLAAVEELGYRPSRAARSLAGRATGLIGYPLPDPGVSVNQTLDAFLHALVIAAEVRDLEIVLFAHRPGDMGPYGDLIGRHAVDAFVLSGTDYDDPRVSYLADRGFPMAAFGRSATPQPFPWVDIDGAAGMAAVVEHLVALGHHDIDLLAWPEGSETGDDRVAGFTRAVAAAGIRPGRVVRTTGGVAGGRSAFARLLDEGRRPGAVVTVQDELALGAHVEARARGIAVGRDMAITGFDDIPSVSVVEPALTSVRQPFEIVGHTLVDLIVDAIDGGSPRNRLVTPQLVVRESSSGAIR